jgi:hypothetical protein
LAIRLTVGAALKVRQERHKHEGNGNHQENHAIHCIPQKTDAALA